MRVLRLFIILMLMLGTMTAVAQESDPELDDLLADYVSEDEPGVVLLIDTPDGSWQAVRGLANLETGEAIQAGDAFRIGSVTKTFVSVVVLQLVEAGQLDLEDTVADWLEPDQAGMIPYADQMTVRQLLNMTAGTFDYLGSDAFWDVVETQPEPAWTASDLLVFVEGEEPSFAPGEGWEYSNTNYILLELIIEAVTGQALGAVLDAQIFTPLGMMHSYMEPPTDLGAGIVRGYSDYGDGDFIDVTTINEGVGLGDGGIISTAADLVIFVRALANGDLLSEESMAAMLDYVSSDEGDYGLGIGRDMTDYGELIGHDGATAGFQSAMVYLVEEDAVIIVLTNNFDSEIVEDLVEEVLIRVAED